MLENLIPEEIKNEENLTEIDQTKIETIRCLCINSESLYDLGEIS